LWAMNEVLKKSRIDLSIHPFVVFEFDDGIPFCLLKGLF